MSEAVTAGGGQVMAGSYLGTGASHVVCHPQTAVKWLAMGKSNRLALCSLMHDICCCVVPLSFGCLQHMSRAGL